MNSGNKIQDNIESGVPVTQEEHLNQLRKTFRNADIIWKSVTAAVIAVAFVYIYFAYTKLMFSDGPLRIILAVIILLAIPFSLYVLPFLLKMSSKHKKYNTEYKNNFLQEKIFAELPKADYKAKERISIKEISECSMIKRARSANANDCIEGTYKGMDFLRYDMELSYKKSRRISNCVLIACSNRTELNSEIQIVEKDFKIGKVEYERPDTYVSYVSGDEDFDKRFHIYVQNEEDANAFIDKEFMKKISKFSGGGAIAAFFDKKKVYLIINRKKDSMEAPVYRAVKESHCKKEAEKETDIIKKWLQFLDDCVVR